MKLVDRKTGALVDVPDDQAQAAFMSGQYGVPKGAAMPVKLPGVAAGTVEAADAPTAFGSGARVATAGEYRQAQQEARYGGTLGAVEAGAVGAARGAASAFGVPLDAAALDLAQLGGADSLFRTTTEIDPYQGARTVSPTDALRERLTGLQAQHGIASGVGELGGMVGAAALGGGALGAVGRGAEAVAGRGLVGAVTRNAAEGGLLGALGAVNESALGDTKLTAAKVMASVGHGALIGGALGGGLHLGGEAVAGMRDRFGRWVSSLTPESIEKVAEGHFGFAPKGLGDRIREAVRKDPRFVDSIVDGGIASKTEPELWRAVKAARERGDLNEVERLISASKSIPDPREPSLFAKVSSAASGKDADLIDRFTSLSPEGAEARRIAVFDAPKIQEEAERAVRKHVDDLLSAGDLVSAEARGGLKASYVKGSVARGNEREVAAYTSQRLQALIEGAEAQLGQEMAPTMIKSVESVSKLAYRAQEAIATGDAAEMFIALDNVKRGVQRLTSTGYRTIRAVADPVDQLNAKRTVAWLDGAAAELRAGLENEALWGKAAVDQRAINAAWTKQIDASNRFHRSLTTDVGRDPTNPYVQMRGADPAKVASYVRNLTNPHNDLTHKAVRDFVSSTQELSEAIGRSYELPADKLAEVARVKAAADGFKKTISEAEETLVTANQYRILTEGPESASLGGLLGTVGGIVGGLPGGILGTLAGGAAGALANPGRIAAKLAAVERLASKVDHEITNGVRAFLSGSGPKRVAGKLPPPASVEMLAGKGGPRATFEAKVKEVQRLAANKQELVGRVQEFTSQFDEAAPSVATYLTAAAIKGVDYLARHAPPGFAQRPEALEWGLHEEPLYTDAEMREWSRRAAVVNDFRVALKSMQTRMLTPEEAHALREVHTPVFEQLQREFKQQRIAKPGKFSFGQSLQIELMFGVPLTRTLEPDFLRTVQASFAVPEPGPGPKPGGRNIGRAMSGSAQTLAQALQDEG